MIELTYKEEIIDLILKHPPEIPMMVKQAKHYDRIREKDFFRKMAFWVFPSIDSTYFALQTFLLISKEENDKNREILKAFLEKNEKNIKKFVFECFDENFGGFIQTLENTFSTLHSVHCAIGLANCFFVIKNNEDLKFSRPIGKERVTAFFNCKEFQYKKSNISIVESILKFIVSCYDSNTGGFTETPQEVCKKYDIKRFPTVNDTSSAIWCFYQLEEDVFKYLNQNNVNAKDQILNFFNNLKIREDDMVAYKNSTLDDNPWICSTYYADRTIPALESKFDEEEIKNILRFVIKTKKENSAFCAGNNLDPNIIHTKDAMSLIKRHCNLFESLYCDSLKSKNFIENMCQDIANFLEKTYVKGGFATAEKNRYLPNVYATRLAYDIKDYIDYFVEKFKIKKPNMDFWKKEETKEYLLSCFDNEKGAFRGFSYKSEYIPKEYIKAFFKFAA